MRLILNSEKMQFQAASSFEARLDKDGVHRRDKSGGTNLPLYAVKLVAWSDADAETILVTVPVATTPPALQQGDHVVVERLEAMPWVQNGNARVAFRAKCRPPTCVRTAASPWADHGGGPGWRWAGPCRPSCATPG
jgi:hypothetical protein